LKHYTQTLNIKYKTLYIGGEMGYTLDEDVVAKIYDELGTSRAEVKDILATRSSFIAMPLLQRLVRVSRRVQGMKTSEETLLDRGSPHRRWSRPSNYGLEIGRVLEYVVGYAHDDPNVLDQLDEYIDSNKPRDIVHTLRQVMLKHEGAENVHRVFGNTDLGGAEEGTFNQVMQYLLDKSGVRQERRDELETLLLGEVIAFVEGIPYGPSSGLNIAKIALKDLMHGATATLEDRVVEKDERLPHIDNVIVTQGVSEALNWFFGKSGYFQEGDMVIGTVPFYAAYNTLLQEEGIQFIPLPTDDAGALHFDAVHKLYEDISKLSLEAREKIKGTIIINPNNPNGHIYTEQEMKALASLSEVAPNLIFVQDVVYQGYANGNFKFMEEVVPGIPSVISTSYSKSQKRAGARVGGLAATKSADVLFEKAGLLEKVVGAKKTIVALSDMQKGGSASHTTQASPISQIKTVFSGTYDLINAHIAKSKEELAATRRDVMKSFGMYTKDRENDCPYYLLINVFGYVRDNLLQGVDTELGQYVLNELDVPEILLRSVEQNLDLVFLAASFFPLNGMPDFLRTSGYAELYNSKLESPPVGYIRTALPNASPDEFLDTTNRFKDIVLDRVEQLKSEYKAVNVSSFSPAVQPN
jgi:hypothetical protein